MADSDENTIQTLPKSIEAATARYLRIYEQYFRGGANEMRRLRGIAEAKILKLRRKTPAFYEERLPTLINQAASELLNCNVQDAGGLIKFNETHRFFLLVLDQLKKNQPAGEINFQMERERVEERDMYVKQQLKLSKEIEKLDAYEITVDDMGDDDSDGEYQRMIVLLDKKRAELKRVSLIIAKLDCERIEEEPTFELKVTPGSTLTKLTQEQVSQLEAMMLDFLKKHKDRTKLYMDTGEADRMIRQLNIEPGRFTKDGICDLVKDALDAYKTYFREKDNKAREDYYDSLLKKEALKPREGLILESPEDLPDDVKAKLDESEAISKQKMNEMAARYANKPAQLEDYNDKGDKIDSDDDCESVDSDIQFVEEYVKTNEKLLNRIKEEPRDDYDNEAPSDDERLVPEDVAHLVEESKMDDGNESDISDYQMAGCELDLLTNNGIIEEEDEDDDMYELPSYKKISAQLDELFDGVDSKDNVLKKTKTNSTPIESQELEDIETLGVVAPADKVPEVITIDDDDDD